MDNYCGIVNIDKINEAILNALPVGSILQYAGTNIPSGYIRCDGGLISRERYANLFSVVGTAYGEGDGSTTFAIPNFIDRYPRGNDTGYSNQTLPELVGRVYNIATAQGGYNEGGATPTANGVFNAWKTASTYSKEDGNHYSHGNGAFDFYASRSNATYGAKNKNDQTGYVMPYTTHVYFIIKY